jgi:hypothetical protein
MGPLFSEWWDVEWEPTPDETDGRVRYKGFPSPLGPPCRPAAYNGAA